MESSLVEHADAMKAAGLTSPQAALYEALVQNGPLPASAAASKVGVARQAAYKVLDELVELALVEKRDEPGTVARFIAAHPLKLKELGEKRISSLEATIVALTSLYNLTSGKPGIRFFEGEPGIREVLSDSLTSKTEIYTYADVEAIDEYIPQINRDYVAQREKLHIKKKGIAFDTPATRYFLEGYHPGVTEMKLIGWRGVPFKTVMQIYDGKISYFTLGENNLVGVIVSDPHIYRMHTSLFEFLWDSPLAYSPLDTDTQPVKPPSAQK